MKIVKLMVAGFGLTAFVGCGGSGAADIAECTVASDEDVSSLATGSRSCDFLNIEHPTLSSLDALDGLTTVRVLRIRESPLLTQISTFIDLQPNLGAVSVIDAPLQDSLNLSSSNLGSVVLQGTLVRDLTIDSPSLDSLFLTSNPIDSVAVVTLGDLLVEDAAIDTLVAFNSVTELNRLTIRRTSLATSSIEAFVARQTSTPAVEHCGNADDEVCREVTELDPD